MKKCKMCQILSNPRKYASWVYAEKELWIILNLEYPKLDKHYYRPVAVYKKHGEMPGGYNLNKIIAWLKKGMSKNEELVFVDHEHYHICIKQKEEEGHGQ